MKLKDILDMETYLAERCYCPNEIYSSDGFFYQLFYADTECKLLGENEGYFVVIAKPFKEEEKDKAQLVIIYKNGNKVADTVSYDATENNIKIFKMILAKTPVSQLEEQGYRLDEYNKDHTAKALQEVFSIADAIMID